MGISVFLGAGATGWCEGDGFLGENISGDFLLWRSRHGHSRAPGIYKGHLAKPHRPASWRWSYQGRGFHLLKVGFWCYPSYWKWHGCGVIFQMSCGEEAKASVEASEPDKNFWETICRAFLKGRWVHVYFKRDIKRRGWWNFLKFTYWIVINGIRISSPTRCSLEAWPSFLRNLQVKAWLCLLVLLFWGGAGVGGIWLWTMGHEHLQDVEFKCHVHEVPHFPWHRADYENKYWLQSDFNVQSESFHIRWRRVQPGQGKINQSWRKDKGKSNSVRIKGYSS